MALRDMLKKTDKDTPELLVGLDIGTEVVKALIAEIKDDNLEIISVGRKQQEMGDMHLGAIADIAGVVANCEAALTEAEDQAGIQGKRHDVLQQEADLTAGHGILRYTGLITISAPTIEELDAHVALLIKGLMKHYLNLN